MEKRFDASWKNKEVRVWVYVMFPILVITIVIQVLSFQYESLFPLGLVIPFVAGLSYRFWRNKNRRKNQN